MERCQLYLISPPDVTIPPFSEQLKAALGSGGVPCFQLRLKTADHKPVDDDTILRTGEALLRICADNNVAFILNDRPDLAKRIGADGVHLGQDDGGVKAARALLGDDASIGVSCHDSKHLAMIAGEDGADYVAFGAFHTTKSKSAEALAKYGTPTVEILDWWQTYTVVPCVAIGGMTLDNCTPIVKSGADFVAVITAIWQHPDGSAAAVAAFNRVLEACHE